MAQNQGGGKLAGLPRAVDRLPVPRASLMQYFDHHPVSSLSEVRHTRNFLWALDDVERLASLLDVGRLS